jgi:short-chain fatty acids transporter
VFFTLPNKTKKMKSIRLKTPGFPDPLLLAIMLSLITMVLAWFLGPNTSSGWKGITDVFAYWEDGFWDLLGFSMQMVLILFLGYMLALTPILDGFSNRLARLTSRPGLMVIIVAFVALILGFLNWGLALVFGAVFVKN